MSASWAQLSGQAADEGAGAARCRSAGFAANGLIWIMFPAAGGVQGRHGTRKRSHVMKTLCIAAVA
ncbi:hypothetical protein, partial [Salmonella sp. s60474]|uniref:hypothetical protein n=1 Tax=Salmonella sp. s60474 TaxID=3159724 RepID=UPI0039817D93